MGAQLSTVAPTATVPIDAYIAELGDLTYSADLGRSRFLKTVKAVHRDGVAAVKVFIKPTTTQIDIAPAKLQAKTISDNLRHDLGPSNEFPHAIGYSRIVETERAGYLVRQYIKHSLYDRISTRPFLEPIEKRWISYQLLRALKSLHERQFYHGDIKSENVLVGSWKWIYLVDFAPFKPVKLPETDSAQFLFYFDVSQRRACYVAPERFSVSGPDSLNAEMDIYSAGCVIAELFLDGQPLFTLADLFKYKRGEHQPDLSSIEDARVRELILSMVDVEPTNRMSAAQYLDRYRGTLFPEFFDTFWDLLVPYSGSAGATSSNEMVEHIWDRFETEILEKSMGCGSSDGVGGNDISSSFLPIIIKFPRSLWIPRSRPVADIPAESGALIILSYVCSALTSTSTVDWRLRAAKLVLALAEYVPDDAKLDRCLPYLVFLLRDSQPAVKALALALITHLMSMVSTYSPLNEKVFTAYLFPRLSQALNSSSPDIMRAVYAACLPDLANYAINCEGRDAVIGIIDDGARFLLVDKASIVRRCLLSNLDSLCAVLGKQGTNDIILSHAITYLNDKNPMVRMDLFRFIARVAPLIGFASVEQYVVPLLVQSLCDPSEDIVALVIQSFASMAEIGLLRQNTLLYIVAPSCVKFLIHPNVYFRTHTLLFIAAAAKQLSKAQVYCLLRPLLTPYFSSEVSDYSNPNLLIEALRPHISQAVYSMALNWAMQAKKSAFWQPSAPSPNATVTFSQEDRRWLARIREVGFNNEDLWQLLAFRDYLWQLSLMSARSTPQMLDFEQSDIDQDVSISKSNVIPNAVTANGRPCYTSKSGLASWKGGPIPKGLDKYVEQRDKSKSAKDPTILYIDSQWVGQSKLSVRGTTPEAKGEPVKSPSDGNNSDMFSDNKPALPHEPEGRKPSVLVGSIKAHRGSIQMLETHPNNRVFVTAADDGLVKLWDAKLLLKGSSRPVLTWNAQTEVTAGIFLGSTSILVVGTQSGKISFLDCKLKSSEAGPLSSESLTCIAEYQVDSKYPVAFHNDSNTFLWILLSDGAIQRLEVATLEARVVFECPKEHGAPSCWAWDSHKNWVVVGTLHGMIELFDIRFELLVNSWGISDLEPITALELHPLKKQWVCVSGGFKRNLISVWDVQKVECRELLVPQPDQEDEDEKLPSLYPVPSSLQSLPERFASWNIKDTFSRPKLPVTSLYSSKRGGGHHLLSGGGDKTLRYWDLRTPHESSVVSGTNYKQAKLNYMGKVGSSVRYTLETAAPSKSSARLSRAAVIGLEEQDIGRNHRGTIVRVALLELPQGRDLAISVDEVGVVKVYS